MNMRRIMPIITTIVISIILVIIIIAYYPQIKNSRTKIDNEAEIDNETKVDNETEIDNENEMESKSDSDVSSAGKSVTVEGKSEIVISRLSDKLGFRLYLPEGWDYIDDNNEKTSSIKSDSKEDTTEIYVKFWKKDTPECVYMFLASDMWSMCGTGVTIEEFTREDGNTIRFYSERIWLKDEEPAIDEEHASDENHIVTNPDYIFADYVFEDIPGSYVLEYMGDYDVFMKQKDEIMDILNKCEVAINRE